MPRSSLMTEHVERIEPSMGILVTVQQFNYYPCLYSNKMVEVMLIKSTPISSGGKLFVGSTVYSSMWLYCTFIQIASIQLCPICQIGPFINSLWIGQRNCYTFMNNTNTMYSVLKIRLLYTLTPLHFKYIIVGYSLLHICIYLSTFVTVLLTYIFKCKSKTNSLKCDSLYKTLKYN